MVITILSHPVDGCHDRGGFPMAIICQVRPGQDIGGQQNQNESKRMLTNSGPEFPLYGPAFLMRKFEAKRHQYR